MGMARQYHDLDICLAALDLICIRPFCLWPHQASLRILCGRSIGIGGDWHNGCDLRLCVETDIPTVKTMSRLSRHRKSHRRLCRKIWASIQPCVKCHGRGGCTFQSNWSAATHICICACILVSESFEDISWRPLSDRHSFGRIVGWSGWLLMLPISATSSVAAKVSASTDKITSHNYAVASVGKNFSFPAAIFLSKAGGENLFPC
jgi:hypothetical protein